MNGTLFLSLSADVRSADDVIAFEGSAARLRPDAREASRRRTCADIAALQLRICRVASSKSPRMHVTLSPRQLIVRYHTVDTLAQKCGYSLQCAEVRTTIATQTYALNQTMCSFTLDIIFHCRNNSKSWRE